MVCGGNSLKFVHAVAGPQPKLLHAANLERSSPVATGMNVCWPETACLVMMPAVSISRVDHIRDGARSFHPTTCLR